MKALLPLLLLTACSSAAPDPWARLTSGEVCAGYVARKTLLLVAELPVVGTTCGVSLQTMPGVRVEIPTKTLRSGNTMRDTAVRDLVGADAMIFEAAPGATSGVLTINGEPRPLSVLVTYEPDGSARVTAKTTFTALGLKPPRLAAGLVVSTHDELELYARVPVTRLPVTH